MSRNLVESFVNKPVEKTTLTKHQYNIGRAFSTRLLESIPNSNIDSYYDYEAKNIIISITTYIYSEDMTPLVFEWPKTWWDAFKIRFFPTWLKNKLPSEMTVRRVEPRMLYPKFKPLHKDLGIPVFKMYTNGE